LQSTLLVSTARALVSGTTAAGEPKEPTPTCFVSIRSSRRRTDELAKSPVEEKDEVILMFDQMAASVFRQIGAPTRRALLYDLFSGGYNIDNSGFAKVDRVMQMLDLLLETAAEISLERLARGVPKEAALTVFLWDNVCATGQPFVAVLT
jgi:hypothetical protein